ncbi:ABC-F family ATP-binding cassette domain-containing protein [Porphyromonas circumdentaria]|uniref:ATP-binding cassette, subfamily F, uup n=1 Tax=Porphyromonas circumdentaria TaxID=29524 RepID=A0A1T4P736_9PORP|nr:ABC-F family ATP-binding cassette domain-containing protein [Porphyromonas circumdentaria]MBB6276286.1 ATP-binding cassette subfamily F protein uup [Porphyromonas circumdentaria]MDO4723001.1 ABC-F family ATP-binding cassette domain-containing protein [Porphyromonas circumdentaria]SJZ87314.1 ATP-binding cassette, subfamily F, uup [Porphyromonas circumdentaria]
MLQVDQISKAYGDRLLFSNISFSIEEGEKVGLIAANGTGKTTLMRILVGDETPDTGFITKRRDIKIVYLPQKTQFPEGSSILEACFNPLDKVASLVGEWHKASMRGDTLAIEHLLPQMDALQAWDYERQAEEILHRLSIPDLSRAVDSLSGGEQKRVALAGVLLTSPDLLILDEPTNHLDLEVIEWLEKYLSRSKLSLLLITHDRYFLDRVCSSFMELTPTKVYSYKCGFERYLELRVERLETEREAAQKASNLYRRELEWMRRQPQARGGKQKARKDAFYELQQLITPPKEEQGPQLAGGKVHLGNKIFSAQGVSLSFGEKAILKGFEYTFARYDKLGIVGPNGVGKTTFLKLLLGELIPDKGFFDVGETVRFGYFSQRGGNFLPDKRVIEVMTDIADNISLPEGEKTISASQMLTRFLFTPERQYTPIEKLSGGELRRLYLCTVLVQSPNFLILDEPTNDLDLITLGVLEEYLREFKGCLIIVSHDRYFMDALVDHLFVFEGDGIVRDFPGNYSQYREWKEQIKTLEATKLEQEKEKKTSSSSQEKEQRKERKVKRSYKEEKEFERLEFEVAELEEKIAELSQTMSSGMLASDRLLILSREYETLSALLEEKSMRWLELSELGS